jgi:exonuclease III
MFRIATLNVFEWKTENRIDNNVSALIELLKPLNLDCLAMQEVKQDNNLKQLMYALDMPHKSFSESYKNNTGECFISKNRIIKQQRVYTDGRSMLSIQIDHSFCKTNNVQFLVTHLDHIYEKSRFQQLKYMSSKLFCDNGVSLLLGDLNSLCQQDYSQDYLQKIVQSRAKALWELPKFDVIKLVQDLGFSDCWRELNDDVWDDQVSTCRFGTRIDYIWRKGALKNWKLSECQIVNTQGASDHEMVMATFRQE